MRVDRLGKRNLFVGTVVFRHSVDHGDGPSMAICPSSRVMNMLLQLQLFPSSPLLAKVNPSTDSAPPLTGGRGAGDMTLEV